MQDQRAHVAEVAHVAEQLESFDEGGRRALSAVHGEGEDRPVAARVQPLGHSARRARCESRIVDRGDLGLLLKPARHGRRVRGVALDPEREGLDSLLQEEGIERRDGRSEAAGDRVPDVGEIGAVAVTGVIELLPALRIRREVEGSRVDDGTAERRSVSGEELARRVHDDIGAPLERAVQVRGGEGVVDDQRHAGLVRDGGDGGNIQDLVARVRDRLGEEDARFGANESVPGIRIIDVVYEVDLDTETREVLSEQAARPLVDVAC